ncbi:predicted protein [Nematostella vectensis]|uniref:Uncharacterized protein n=1 Tax=Nematostella vectensis TaxID=45351 RepID=A7SPB9_NEMVE|nr:predicted protein [Nematostella vectensis]|eukprot:XP_001626546.1 predicted protein [Nematostella vectensis]
MCLFCQKKKHKGSVTLSTDSSNTIREAARIRNDEDLLLNINCADLIAAKAKYHRECRSTYVAKRNLSFAVDGADSDMYTIAFINLMDKILPEIQSGRAVDMKTVLLSYQDELEGLSCDTTRSYITERLKRRIQQTYHAQADPTKPELLYSSSISYQRRSEEHLDNLDISNPTAVSATDERRVLAIAQDLVYFTTHARIKPPKHIGLAMSVRHLTGSKQLIRMLHRFGHCCSYDDVEVADTSLAQEAIEQSKNRGVVIPSNIYPGSFIQVAADNNDLNEETLDGRKTTHATTIVLFQRKQFGPRPEPITFSANSGRRCSLWTSDGLFNVMEFGTSGKRSLRKFTKNGTKPTTPYPWFSRITPKYFPHSNIQPYNQYLAGHYYAAALPKGKSYNRGVRAHKLVLEALLRLRWQAFCVWLNKDRDTEVDPNMEEECMVLINICRCASDVGLLQASFSHLCEKLLPWYEAFCTDAAKRLKMFAFWNNYIEVVSLLLRLIRAEREGSWELHLTSVNEMFPYFYSMDRINYSRLLIAAKFRDVILQHVLCYELSSVPFALAHADGTLRKTTKSVLLTEIEKVQPPQNQLPPGNDTCKTALVFDGMALVQALRFGGARTIKDLSDKHFRLLVTPLRQGQCSRVDIVFDRYDVPLSIKEAERDKRGQEMTRAVIQSPDTDVDILAIHAFERMGCRELWFKTGYKDRVRFIPIHDAARKLGPKVCAAIPGLHALTRCDTTSWLANIGKTKPHGKY